MFTRHTSQGFINALPGIDRKTLVHGERTLLSEFHMAKGSHLPLHSHPNEQTGYLIAGHIQLLVGEIVMDATPGDSWCIPAGQPHSAEILEDSVVIEVFSPVREDYLP
jgi:quercetin dioxygenase-like cupin family protein